MVIMSDRFSEEKRSAIMRAVKSKGNKSTEIRLITIFKELNIKGWRRCYNVKGHPDFVFIKKRIAIFVDGCFWHGHGCRKMPISNNSYWDAKIGKNIERDAAVTRIFEARGWSVIRIWECELAKSKREYLMEKLRILFNVT